MLPVLTFTEAKAGGCTILNVTNDTVIETIAYDSSIVTGWGTDQLTITPSAPMPTGKEIAVQLGREPRPGCETSGWACSGGQG